MHAMKINIPPFTTFRLLCERRRLSTRPVLGTHENRKTSANVVECFETDLSKPDLKVEEIAPANNSIFKPDSFF